MYKIAYVLVNYMNYSVAQNCIDSLVENEPNGIIIAVDNYSSNDSYEKLIEFNKNHKNVHVFKTNENIGYAQALNVGIEFARKNFLCDYVMILNSDILFKEYEGVERTIENNCTLNTGLISFSMKNEDDSFQNPYGCYNQTPFIVFIKSLLFIVREKLKILFKKKNNIKGKSYEYYKNKYSYIINTAAGILTPNFFENYNYLYNKTFFYMEEACLYFLLKKADLHSVFSNDCIIYHLEKQSSDNNDYYKKKIRRLSKAVWVLLPLVFMTKHSLQKKLNNLTYKNKLYK